MHRTDQGLFPTNKSQNSRSGPLPPCLLNVWALSEDKDEVCTAAQSTSVAVFQWTCSMNNTIFNTSESD